MTAPLELTPSDFLDSGFEALKKIEAYINGLGPGGAVAITDGTHTVASATEVNFTSGATVTDAGGGVADVAVSGGGGGLTGFVSSLDTTAPNDVVPVAVLMAFDGTSESDQCDVAIVPSGVLGSSTTIGAFSLQTPDGTTAGGNKRGVSAVDLQLWRNDPTQVASGLSAFAAGSANIASAFGSVAIGDANTSSSIRSIAIGENNVASHGASIAMGAKNTSSGDSAVALGLSNTASSAAAIAMGSTNTASGNASLALGFSNTASAAYSAVLGGNNNLADGINSAVKGTFGYSRGINNAEIYGIGTSLGNFQHGRYYLRATTADATPIVLSSSGGPTPSINAQILLPNGANGALGASYVFRGQVVAVDTATGHTSAWSFVGAIKQLATAASTALVAAVVATLIAQDAALATAAVAISADTTNGILAIIVTGIAATNIQWMCDVQTSETTY